MGFWPKPRPRLHVGERAAPLLPPCHLSVPTTSQHHPTLPFHMARPKLSHRRSVFGILAQPPPPASRWRMCSPLAASVSSTRTHHLPASPYAAVSHGTPETEPQKLGFRVFGPNHITRPRVGECPAPPPPLFHLLATTTSQDCTTPQFYRNRATEARFLGFWPNPCPLTSR